MNQTNANAYGTPYLFDQLSNASVLVSRQANHLNQVSDRHLEQFSVEQSAMFDDLGSRCRLLADSMAAGKNLMSDLADYLIDSGQRTVLFWDTMRQAGNIHLEHARRGTPPVLIYDYEMIIDGRKLKRPVNYALVRIKPEGGATPDPTRRPYIIIDPRAGHGAGIGGSKSDSQVGVAMGAGHPVYLDRKSTRLNSSHSQQSRMPSSA